MTYLAFHAVFTVPASVVLAAAAYRRRALTPRRVAALAVIVVLAVAYTTPWDRYLVLRGVWGYGPERVLATFLAVPVEEYLFFVLQPLLTGFWLFLLLGRGPVTWHDAAPGGVRIALVVLWAAAAAAGLALLASDRTLYLGLTLAWCAPILLVQSAYGGHQLARHVRLVALAVGVPTLYLWAADRIALALGVWHLSDRYTTGIALFGLPVEEALFFLVTNLMVVQGVVLALAAVDRHRRHAVVTT